MHVPLTTFVSAGTPSPTGAPASVGVIGGMGGDPLDLRTLTRLSCDATLRRLITDPATGAVLDEGRSVRVPGPALRRSIEIRDGGACTFPGCGRRFGLQAHHLRPWAQGGATDTENLTTLCSRHHHLIHDAAWTVRRDETDELRWQSPAGQRINVPVAQPAEPDPPWYVPFEVPTDSDPSPPVAAPPASEFARDPPF